MPLRNEHLDVLRLANLPFSEEIVDLTGIRFIGIQKENIVETIEYLHKQYPEDIPIIPIKLDGYDKYILYVNNNDKV